MRVLGLCVCLGLLPALPGVVQPYSSLQVQWCSCQLGCRVQKGGRPLLVSLRPSRTLWQSHCYSFGAGPHGSPARRVWKEKIERYLLGNTSIAIGEVNSSDGFLLARSLSRQGALGLHDKRSACSPTRYLFCHAELQLAGGLRPQIEEFVTCWSTFVSAVTRHPLCFRIARP